MTVIHKHHIIPKHMGGTDEPHNLVELSVEEHANAHRELYDKHKKYFDYIAWKTLSGQITHSEAKHLARKHRDTSYMQTDDYRKKVSTGKKGCVAWNKGKQGVYTQTLESNKKRSIAGSGGNNPRAKKVLFNGMVFACIKDAAKYDNKSYSYFSKLKQYTILSD